MKYFPFFLLLTACSNQMPAPDVNEKTYTFKIHLVDTLPDKLEGLHVYDKDINLHGIWILKGDYPGCLLHEIMHILDKEWHKGRNTLEYCYNR